MANSIGIISPGDMGSAIGRVLVDAGFTVITALDGRSELTKQRAQEAGMRDARALDLLVEQSDIVLSVLVPAEALTMARLVAESISHTRRRPVYADLNAISPQTVREIGRTM